MHEALPENAQALRAALERVALVERDAWVDALLGIDGVPDDGPELPRGCVPYLPCPVDPVLRALDAAGVGPGDVLVDVGSGLGRVAVLAHLLTGAAAIGLEIQPHLVESSRAIAGRMGLSARVTFVEGDAARLTGELARGTVFFLYAPFSGERLDLLLRELEDLARTRPIRVCCVDVPLSAAWLTHVSSPAEGVAIFRSNLDGVSDSSAARGPVGSS